MPAPPLHGEGKAGSVPEHTHAGEHHGQAAFVGGIDHRLIADGPAGLDDRCTPRFRRLDQAVGEREEGL